MAYEQLYVNPRVPIQIKDGIFDLWSYWSESTIKEIARRDKSRFFYKGSNQMVGRAMYGALADYQKRYLQGVSNRTARGGRDFDNAFINTYFPPTYSRNGRYYYEGKQVKASEYRNLTRND